MRMLRIKTTTKNTLGNTKCPFAVFASHSRHSHYDNGFTLTEVVVMTAIIVFISTTVLVSFSGFNENIALNRAARGLTLSLRQAQSFSLGTAVVGASVPPYAGIKLSMATMADAKKYVIFSDLNNLDADPEAEGNLIYDEPPDITIQQENFEKNIKINSLRNQGGPLVTSVVHVLFSSPEATVFLTDNGGASIGDYLEIELISPSGKTKKVTVRTSGQISIK